MYLTMSQPKPSRALLARLRAALHDYLGFPPVPATAADLSPTTWVPKAYTRGAAFDLTRARPGDVVILKPKNSDRMSLLERTVMQNELRRQIAAAGVPETVKFLILDDAFDFVLAQPAAT